MEAIIIMRKLLDILSSIDAWLMENRKHSKLVYILVEVMRTLLIVLSVYSRILVIFEILSYQSNSTNITGNLRTGNGGGVSTYDSNSAIISVNNLTDNWLADTSKVDSTNIVLATTIYLWSCCTGYSHETIGR